MAIDPVSKKNSAPNVCIAEKPYSDTVKTSISNGFKYAHQLSRTPEAWQRVVCFCMEAFKLMPRETIAMVELNKTFGPYDDTTDSIGVFDSAHWLISGECLENLEEGRYSCFASKVSFLFAGVGSSLGLASNLNLLDVGRASVTIGSTRVLGYAMFKFVPALSLVTFIRSTVALGYVGAGLDAMEKIENGKNPQKYWREVAFCAMQFMIKLFALTNLVTNPTALAAFGVISWGVGINVILFSENVEEDKKQVVDNSKTSWKLGLPFKHDHDQHAALVKREVVAA